MSPIPLTRLTYGEAGARLVVVADSHSTPHAAMARRLAELQPMAILHAGDVGRLTVLDGLREMAPVYAVRGNIDGHGPEIPERRLVDLEGPYGRLRMLLLHIAVRGPKLRSDVARLAQARGATLVVCGHSHVPFIGADRGLTVFNPGSIGPRRFALPILFGLLELDAGGVRLQHLSCATGEPWRPPAPGGASSAGL